MAVQTFKAVLDTVEKTPYQRNIKSVWQYVARLPEGIQDNAYTLTAMPTT